MNSQLQIRSGPGAQLAWDAAPDSSGAGAAVAHGGASVPAPQARPDQIRADITMALMRHARREAGRIAIDVAGGVVTLHGEVDTKAEHDAAVGTALAAQGVTCVIDRLEISGRPASE